MSRNEKSLGYLRECVDYLKHLEKDSPISNAIDGISQAISELNPKDSTIHEDLRETITAKKGSIEIKLDKYRDNSEENGQGFIITPLHGSFILFATLDNPNCLIEWGLSYAVKNIGETTVLDENQKTFAINLIKKTGYNCSLTDLIYRRIFGCLSGRRYF
ncbi:MAG: hypothetical protein ACYDDE_03960 [bacterium]